MHGNSPGTTPTINLIAAGTNALNGAILCRRPDHYKNFTVVGVILMAILGGIGGGATRDVLVNRVPSALTNPVYLTTCVVLGIVGLNIAYSKGQLFREGVFQFAIDRADFRRDGVAGHEQPRRDLADREVCLQVREQPKLRRGHGRRAGRTAGRARCEDPAELRHLINNDAKGRPAEQDVVDLTCR